MGSGFGEAVLRISGMDNEWPTLLQSETGQVGE